MPAPDYPTDKDVKELCKIGQGHDCCRYLTVGAKGWSCEKKTPGIKALLDQRVELKTMNARGDNCPGKDSR